MFISYAQNLEDVLLWRCFKDLENGTYIDVGANDPSEDSVTKAFYDRGWSGINIEPIQRHHDDLTAQRPRDINLLVAAGDKKGKMDIADVPAVRGWATMDEAVALAIDDSGHEVVRSKTPVRTLDDICEEHNCNEIHFLKIDVEGFEGRVIQGIDFKKIKPWVLVIEAYCGNKGRIDNEDWEPYVLGAGYKLAFFDGLNCFYVSEDHEDLLPLFDTPVNVVDDYIRHRHLEATERAHAVELVLSSERERFAKSTEEFQHSAAEAAANLAEASTSVTSLTAEVLSKQNTIEENEAEIRQKTEAVKSAQIELQRKDEAIAKAESKLRTKEEANDKIEAKILQKDEVIEKAEAKILQKDEVIKTVEAKVRQKDEVIEKLDDKTKHLQRELVELREQTELDKKAAVALVAQVQELNHSSHHWYVHSQTLEQALDAANLALHAVKSSVFWRLTWPLRKLYELIRFITLTVVALVTFIIKSPWYLVRAFLLSVLWCIRLSPKTAALLERVIRKIPIVHRWAIAIASSNPAPHRVEKDYLADVESPLSNEAVELPPAQSDAELYDFRRGGDAVYYKREKRVLYYYIDHTVACPENTGIQRVVRQLARSLLAIGEVVVFVKWSEELSCLVLADSADLKYLQKWNGPEALSNAPLNYPHHGIHEPISIAQMGEPFADWLVVPEVTHMNYHKKSPTLGLFKQAQSSGLQTAFIFYDATPLRREELRGMTDQHATYMQQLLLADLLLPISQASAADLASFFRIDQSTSDESIPRIAPVPLAGEQPQFPRVSTTSKSNAAEQIILCVGSFAPHKNQTALIEAFQMFLAEHPDTDWKLLFVGNMNAADHQKLVAMPKAIRPIAGWSFLIGGFSDESVELTAGDSFCFDFDMAHNAGNQRGVGIEHRAFPQRVFVDDIFIVDQGELRLRVDDVRERAADCTVLIGGKLSSRAAVHKHGVSDDQLATLYESAAFTVFPSVMEGFGLPILESLWHGKPCICADFGAMAEVAEGGGCLTVDTRDSKNIYSAIAELTSSESLLQQLTKEAVSRDIESWVGYAKKLSDQLTEAGNPLSRVGTIFYDITHTCQYPNNSGIQRVVRGLARSLISNGMKLVPVLFDTTECKLIPASPDQLSHMSNFNGPSKDGWSDWAEPASCTSNDWLLGPELTHLYTEALLTAAKDAGLRTAYVFYDAIPHKMTDIYPPVATEAHRCYMEDLNECDLVFPISEFSEGDLIDFLDASALHTPNLQERMRACVLPGEFMESDRTLDIMRKDPADQTIRVLCVGTVEPRKNHLTLFKAFKKIKSEYSGPIELVIAGGQMFEDLSQEVANYVDEIPGLRWEVSPSDEKLRDLYEACDFTVYPSLEEGFGLPILESIWNAKPCVCHHEGAMREVASEGGCVMANAASPELLAAGMMSLIQDRENLLSLTRECTQINFKTWFDYGKEVATRIAMVSAVPAVRSTLAAPVISSDAFYAEMPNLERKLDTHNALPERDHAGEIRIEQA